jgi:hypothetical protein
MAVLVSLGSNSAGDGLLLAPLGITYEADLVLQTDAGNAAVTLQASPNAAGLVFSQTAVNISTAATIVKVHATLQSTARGDTTIQVLDGGAAVASFTVTAIKHPVINFRGRFEARFATQPAFYNQNAMYTATSEAVGPGWTWGLEGEPDFVPTVGNVPENLETADVGRVIRLNNPVALRSQVAAVVSTVDSITGETASGTETFFTGDPLIGQPVDFGSDTYFAGNRNINTADPRPEEFFTDAQEPLGLFEIHFGILFSGASQVGPFTHQATFQDEKTRSPDSRPIATGLVGSSAERAEFGLNDVITVSEAKIDLLVTEYNALAAGDTPQRRNLARRIGHLLSAVSSAKATAVQTANPGAFTPRTRTLSAGWVNKEVFNGKVDANLVFMPSGSSVVAYMAEFQSFNFQWHPFAFHSDELCAHHKGTLTPDLNFHGSYTGDPHTHTVDGTTYDFQSVGEFTLLRNGERMEVQVRQTPVATQHPVTDSYSGLTACVSVITAVAARVGKHTIALQPGGEKKQLILFVDGKPTRLSADGLDLGGHQVAPFDADGEIGVRVDYADGTILIATPAFWDNHDIWYINVSVSNTTADEGIMGFIPKDSWLPRLRNGTSMGPMPSSLQDRYVALYKAFADSWRVTDKTSLFVYPPGTSTKTFADRDWPAEKSPCRLKPQFEIPGVKTLKGIPIAEAKRICNGIAAGDLHNNCVFDVATTGDPIFANGYRLAQELRRYGTSVQIAEDEPPSRTDRLPVAKEYERPLRANHPLLVTATVIPLTPGRPVPTGEVTFFVDGIALNRPVKLDTGGRARVTLTRLRPGGHKIRAAYAGGGEHEYHSSSSRTLRYTLPAKPGGPYVNA